MRATWLRIRGRLAGVGYLGRLPGSATWFGYLGSATWVGYLGSARGVRSGGALSMETTEGGEEAIIKTLKELARRAWPP
jgi:hypothetical protein